VFVLKLGADRSRTSLSSAGLSRLKLLGPIQRDSLWEITAVRELRLEAQKIAKEVMHTLELHSADDLKQPSNA
jgi:hypothetical protein